MGSLDWDEQFYLSRAIHGSFSLAEPCQTFVIRVKQALYCLLTLLSSLFILSPSPCFFSAFSYASYFSFYFWLIFFTLILEAKPRLLSSCMLSSFCLMNEVGSSLPFLKKRKKERKWLSSILTIGIKVDVLMILGYSSKWYGAIELMHSKELSPRGTRVAYRLR